MVAHDRIVPLVGVFHLLGLSIGNVLVVVSSCK